MARACDPDSLDPLPRQAYRAALAWLDTRWTEHPARVTEHPVFAQCDPNLANHLWDGHRVHLVDFESSGRGNRTTELADFVEHVTVWAHAGGHPAAPRRERLPPQSPGTFERQANRLLGLLGTVSAPVTTSRRGGRPLS
jgi:hypothetical protein